MTTQGLTARLNPLFESLKQTQQLITRLSKLPAQPGAAPSNPDEGDARLELSAEIHQSLKEQEEEYELLRQEAEDLTSNSGWSSSAARRGDSVRDGERTDLAAQVTRLGEDLKIARAQYRKAQLHAKRAAETARRKERELLFAGIQEGTTTTTPSSQNRRGKAATEKLSQDEILLSASSDVTAALRRTHTLLTSELERSQFARETLETSTKSLSTLTESYSDLGSLLSSSRSLVSTLITSQKSDTWYLESAFLVLCVTIGWLVFRRILYGPGWWLVYFPLTLIWRFALFAAQILLGTFATVTGAVGAKSESSVLVNAAASLSASSSSSSSSVVFAATTAGRGKNGIPTFPKDMQAPTIRVGGGGRGAKAEASGQAESLSDRIGEMAEGKESGDGTGNGEVREEGGGGAGEGEGGGKATSGGGQETVLRERREDEAPNPKKRMWEEPVGDTSSPSAPSSTGDKPRDEL